MMRLFFGKKKMVYLPPMVRGDISMCLEHPILATSAVTPNTQVKTTGQKIDSYDFSDSSQFNQSWE